MNLFLKNISRTLVTDVNIMWLLAALLFHFSGFALGQCDAPTPCQGCTGVPTAGLISVGNYIVWGCEEGYEMDGPMDRIVWVCGPDNRWRVPDGNDPICIAVYRTCPYPPVPAYGSVANRGNLDDVQPGETITYECESGYTLQGSSDNTCGENGAWSNDAPTCIRDTCSGSIVSIRISDHACQFLVLGGTSWSGAKSACERSSATLATVKTAETQSQLENIAGILPVRGNVWIGATEGRNWKWSRDDTIIYRLFWSANSPRTDSGPDCIELNGAEEFTWTDNQCSIRQKYICQYDWSCDGLRHNQSGTSTLDYGGRCYVFASDQLSWEEARDTCRSSGANLAAIEDLSAQEIIADHLRDVESDAGENWWIDGYDDIDDRDRAWFWVDNTRVEFAAWYNDQPSSSSQRCVEMNGESMDYLWNDRGCGASRHALCQQGTTACGDPGNPDNGWRTPRDRHTFSDGATMEFHCDPGYELVGQSEIFCTPDGTWNSEKPRCRVLSCEGAVPPVENAEKVIGSGGSYRQVALYRCLNGAVPTGSPVSFCQANGTWSTPLFACPDPSTSSSPAISISQTSGTTTFTRTSTSVPVGSGDSVHWRGDPPPSSTVAARMAPVDVEIRPSTHAPFRRGSFSDFPDTTSPITGKNERSTSVVTTSQQSSTPPLVLKGSDSTTDMIYAVAVLAIVITLVGSFMLFVLLRRRRKSKLASELPHDVPTYDVIEDKYRVSNSPETNIYLGISHPPSEPVYMELSQVHTSDHNGNNKGRVIKKGSASPLPPARRNQNFTGFRDRMTNGSLNKKPEYPHRDQAVSEEGGDNKGKCDDEHFYFETDGEGARQSVISKDYETVDTPRPSVTDDTGMTKSKSHRPNANEYDEVDDVTMVFNDLYTPSQGDEERNDSARGNNNGNFRADRRRISSYDQIDDATLIFNDLYVPSDEQQTKTTEGAVGDTAKQEKMNGENYKHSSSSSQPYYHVLEPMSMSNGQYSNSHVSSYNSDDGNEVCAERRAPSLSGSSYYHTLEPEVEAQCCDSGTPHAEVPDPVEVNGDTCLPEHRSQRSEVTELDKQSPNVFYHTLERDWE